MHIVLDLPVLCVRLSEISNLPVAYGLHKEQCSCLECAFPWGELNQMTSPLVLVNADSNATGRDVAPKNDVTDVIYFAMVRLSSYNCTQTKRSQVVYLQVRIMTKRDLTMVKEGYLYRC